MKEVILSADSDSIVYLVPDIVADNLEDYCLEFSSNWLWSSPDAKKYRKGDCVCFNEEDFIEFLNLYLFPDCKSKMLKNLGWTNLGKKLPGKYKNHPYFNF